MLKNREALKSMSGEFDYMRLIKTKPCKVSPSAILLRSDLIDKTPDKLNVFWTQINIICITPTEKPDHVKPNYLSSSTDIKEMLTDSLGAHAFKGQ